MAKKTNCSVHGNDYYRICRKVGKKLNKNGQWVDNYKNFYGSSKTEADEKYQAYINATASELAGNMCLGEALEQWDKTVFEHSNLAEGTKRLYRESYNRFFRGSNIASRKMTEILAPDIQNFFNSNEIPFTSMKHLRNYLKKFFSYAEMNRLASINLSCIEIHKPEEFYISENQSPQVWDMEDVKRVIEAASGTALRFLVVMAVNTGLRINELLALDYTDIHDGYVYVTKQLSDDGKRIMKPKSKTSVRSVPVSEYVMEELKRHRKYQKQEMTEYGYITRHIFSSTVGTYLDRRNINNRLRQLYKDNNIPYLKFHAYRHTYGTNLDRIGYRPSEIQELMGHASIATTMRYVHASGERMAESSERLAALCM